MQLCRDCLEWLLGRIGVTSTPTLPVGGMAEAAAFYERAGFGVRRYRSDDGDPGEGFAFVDYDGQSVFDLDAIADLDISANRAGCYLIANDADYLARPHGRRRARRDPDRRSAVGDA